MIEVPTVQDACKVIPITRKRDQATRALEMQHEKSRRFLFDETMQRLARQLNSDYIALPDYNGSPICVVGDGVFTFRPRHDKSLAELVSRNRIMIYGCAELLGVDADGTLRSHPVSCLAEISEQNVSMAMAFGCLPYHSDGGQQPSVFGVCDFKADSVRALLPSLPHSS